MEVDLQQVQQVTGGSAQRQRERDLQQRLQHHAHGVDTPLLQRVCHAVGGREQHQTHGVVNSDHHQQKLGQRAVCLILLDHHQGSSGCGSGGDRAQRDGRSQRDGVRAGKVQGNKGDIHQRGGDHRLRNAHGHGAASHVLQGAETELVANDEGDKAQRHLRDNAVALHGGKAVKAEAKTAQPQPPQKEGPQQQTGKQISGNGGQTHGLGSA